MKKKILTGLSLFSLVFFLGGIYIITVNETSTSKLDDLLTLHQVELLREKLLLQIKKVQSDLNLKNTRYARNIDTVISNVRGMENLAHTCFDCHHSKDMEQKLNDLNYQIQEYKKAISRLFTLRADNDRLAIEEDKAFGKGELLVTKVNDMIRMASIKLESRTLSSLMEIERTKRILYILVLLVPFLAGGLGFVFIRGFTRPVNVLLNATRRLKSGDLDHRIAGLKDEFGEVADSFNEMALSLNTNIHKIQESEKRYRMLFENAVDAIFMIDAGSEHTGKIVSANRAAAEMHGYTLDELLELNLIKDIDTPEASQEAPGLIERMRNGETVKAEITHLRKDGTAFPVEVCAGLLEFMGHEYILAIDRDISERKRIEETLKRAEQMKLVGEWAAGLAHEIKNSLAGIKISVEVLAEEPAFPEQDRASIFRAIDEIRRIELLLKSLLTYAKPPRLELAATNVNDILDNAISFSLIQSSVSPGTMAHIKTVKEIDKDLPITMADQLQLRQVFVNILINAREAMKNGGTLEVKTAYDAGTDNIKIEISDTGEGIEEKLTEDIFRPFFTTKSKGTGVGLAITKRIIEEHRGTISVRKGKDERTLFEIVLPVKKPDKEQTA